MGAFSGFFRNVWHYFIKKKRKRTLSGCPKVLEKNKNVEQWKEKEPLLHGDYTENRWQSVLDDPSSAQASPRQCCGNLNCACKLVKQYTRALIEGNQELAEQIRSGSFNPEQGNPALRSEKEGAVQGKDKISQADNKPKKLATVGKKPRPLAVCQPTKKKNEKHRVIPPTSSEQPKFISRSCCNKENCGCHVIKEYSRAIAMGDTETAARIRGETISTEKDSKEQGRGVDTINDSDTDPKESDTVNSEDKMQELLDINANSDDDSILKSTRWSRSSCENLDSSTDDMVISRGPSNGEDAPVEDCPEKRQPGKVGAQNITSQNSAVSSESPGGEHDLVTVHKTVDNSTEKEQEMKAVVMEYTIDWPEAICEQTPVTTKTFDSSFFHETPAYYETNENEINRMTHARKAKKNSKRKPKTKQKSVKSSADRVARKKILKVYQPLIEDSSDSETLHCN